MYPYIELHAHHIGSSHIQKGAPCEDYSLTYSDENVSIAVISDGHGDKNCFRSAMGAKVACETAVRACQRFYNSTNQIRDIDNCNFEELVCILKSEIAQEWRTSVLSDAQNAPFSENELSGCSEQAQGAYRSGQRMEKAYGCTLILAMCSAHYWLALQIGDGKCVAAYNDGAFVEPIPNDENCVGNRSTSLCNTNSKDLFRHYYSKLKPTAVFVASDGIEESFDQAGLYNCFYSAAYWLHEKGIPETRDMLSNLLPQISEGGSGDDVSISMLVSKENIINKPRQTLEQIYAKVEACAKALEYWSEGLQSTAVQISELSMSNSSIEDEINALSKKLAEKQQKLKEQQDTLNQLHEKSLEQEHNQRRAEEQMGKARKYQQSAEAYWTSVNQRLGVHVGMAPETDGEICTDRQKPEEPQAVTTTESTPAVGQNVVPDDASAAKTPFEDDDFLAVYNSAIASIGRNQKSSKTVFEVPEKSPIVSDRKSRVHDNDVEPT